MTPNDHRAALFDALTLCERAWGKSLTQPSSDAIQAHDAARDQYHAAVEAMVSELERVSAERDQSLQLAKVTTEHVERLSLDLREAQGLAVEQCVTALRGTKAAARCADCDALLEEVRPGKHQHPDCPHATSATAQPAAIGEPVAWAAYDAATTELVFSDDDMSDSIAWFPLYTTPVAAQPQPPSGDAADERSAFEAWYRHHHGDRDVYALDKSGEYADKQVQGAFNVWQARAKLTATEKQK